MPVNIVGVDCATDPKNVGYAFGSFTEGRTVVEQAALGSSTMPPAEAIADWLADRSGQTLLAMDAPLGWPLPMAQSLPNHNAGDSLAGTANALFRRETDRFIRGRIGKQSLDVGADRIARTAHAALEILETLRQRLQRPITLAWHPAFEGVGAIEVYPAATLVAHGIESAGYKAANGQSARERVAKAVGSLIQIDEFIPAMDSKSDALDAVICLLGAHDFLRGEALGPEDQALAVKEGWIWVRK
jgi:predicted nuclease with RNAse H fold